jgi:hypothetical protein
MRVKKKYLFSMSAFIGCLTFSVNGFAESRIVIQPKVEVGYENNSNFWKSEDQEVSVNTYHAKPGIVLGYETPRTQVSLDTTLEGYWYDDQDTPASGIRDASDDDYVGFAGILSGNYQLTDRVNVGLSEEIYVTRDPAQADANSNSIDRDKYTINYFEPSVYYELTDKFGLLTKYRNTMTDYENDLEDSDENRGIFDLYYTLNSSSTIYLDYQLWARDYDQDTSDYTSNLITLNYERTFKYFTLTGGGGYHNRSFDDDAFDDLDMFSWKFQIKRQDADANAQTTRSRLTLDVGQSMNDDGTGDQYFTSSYLRFEGGYRLTSRIEAIVNVDLQNSDYEESTREDDTYLLSAKLAYQPLDYLTLGIKAGFENRDSNLVGYDYDDVFVLATMDVLYDIGNR